MRGRVTKANIYSHAQYVIVFLREFLGPGRYLEIPGAFVFLTTRALCLYIFSYVYMYLCSTEGRAKIAR